ncbi:MAG: hypothetical protein MUQ75_05485, partial [Crocinitomicaceae bacterium]|nr:hypothetical protein [Crocinitomicaceae bacterium]
MKQKMIVVTGTDGSGKSTVINSIIHSGIEAHVISIWDAMDDNLFPSRSDVDQYLCKLTSNARLLFLAHALHHAMVKAQSSNKTLLFNGYYYKYFASELVLEADSMLVNQLMALFPLPDLVIKLEVDYETAFKRKQSLSSYECGLQAPSETSFKEFQRLAAKSWSHFDQAN